MTKRVLFTRRALTAMEERQIAAEWVEWTVASPDWRETDPGDPAVTFFALCPNAMVATSASLV